MSEVTGWGWGHQKWEGPSEVPISEDENISLEHPAGRSEELIGTIQSV